MARERTKAANHHERPPCADSGMWSDELSFAGKLFFHLRQQSFVIIALTETININHKWTKLNKNGHKRARLIKT